MRPEAARSRKFVPARVALLGATVAAALLAPAVASAAGPASYPASGTLRQESVVVRAKPSTASRKMMVMSDTRTDGRVQIVLAVSGKLVGFVEGAKAQLVLKDESGADALALTARLKGTAGNKLGVTSFDELPGVVGESGLDYLAVYRGGIQIGLVPYTSGNLAELAASLNGQALPVVGAATGTGPLAVTGHVVLAGGKTEKPGTLWYRLNLPIRPLGQRGWIKASAARVAPVKMHIVVHRGVHRLDLFKGATRVFQTRVATGRPDRRTPLGSFYVAAKYVPRPNALVTGYALELSAPAGLPDFEFGGIIGIHGTPATNTLGHDASNGCIRVAPWASIHLARVVPVGTPVRVIP